MGVPIEDWWCLRGQTRDALEQAFAERRRRQQQLGVPGHHLIQGLAEQIAGLRFAGMFGSLSPDHMQELNVLTHKMHDLAQRAQAESDAKWQAVGATVKRRWWQQPWFTGEASA